MSYIDEIFERADLQLVREFILHGGECDVDPRTYKERVEIPQRRLVAKLRERYEGKEEEEITNLVYDYGSASEDVYMEIGLQVGAILVAQVCQNLRTATTGGCYEVEEKDGIDKVLKKLVELMKGEHKC